MALDLSDTLTLLTIAEQSFLPQTFVRDTFFPRMLTFPTTDVKMEYKKGGRKLAPFVSSRGGSVNTSRDGFKITRYTPPMTAPARVTTADDLSKREFGESVISSRNPAERALSLRATDMSELMDMTTRRMEWMCTQALLYGKFDAAGKSEDGKLSILDTVTYSGWTQKQTLTTASDLWTAYTTADIWGNLSDMVKTVRHNSGRQPTVAFGSMKTVECIMKNKSIQDYLLVPNANNLSLLSIVPSVVSPDVTRFAYIPMLNLSIYAYDAIYTDDAGTEQQFIPDGYFVVGVPGRGMQLFGSITQLDQQNNWQTYEGKNVPKVWTDNAHDVEKIRMASKGVPNPEYIDDWYTLKAF